MLSNQATEAVKNIIYDNSITNFLLPSGTTPITTPPVGLPGAELFPFPAAMASLPPGGLIPPPGTFLPPNGLLPFAPHPAELALKSLPTELAMKNGYDALRHLQSNVSSMDTSSARLSPTSSRQSGSPRSINNTSPRSHTKSELNSTHEASDESDEEPIEVVKSAFHPTRPANVELQMKQVQAADSTVADRPRMRNELKAPSQRTRILSSPTSTKITNSSISTQKSVWRPY